MKKEKIKEFINKNLIHVLYVILVYYIVKLMLKLRYYPDPNWRILYVLIVSGILIMVLFEWQVVTYMKEISETKK